MPKLKEEQMKKRKKRDAGEPVESAASDIGALEKRDFKDLIDQIQSEYKTAWDFMKPKLDEWALRLKLYNNQKRDKKAVGDPLMFTVHQTVLASLYSDRLTQEFAPREEGDEDIADNLTALATFDYDDMEKDVVDYEWDWDASFFGRGLCLLMEFDRKSMCPVPQVIDMMTWLRDPHAKSVNGDKKGRGAMRFGGHEIRSTKRDMRSAGIYFNIDKIDDDKEDINSVIDRNRQLRAEAQGLGDATRKALVGENKDYRLLEWFTWYKGKKVLVTLANNRSVVVRFTVLEDGPWPIMDRTIYPMSKDWDGVSIPDLTEDKQRARSIMQNLGIRSAEAGLHPMYLYNTTKIKNKADLNFEFNKFVGVDGDVSGAAVPLQVPGVKQEVKWIMDILDAAAQRATATPEIQQGVQSDQKRTAYEMSLVSSKVDTRYSLSAKIFGWSEKRFWKQWYRLYKSHFDEKIDKKMIRVAGAMGSQWRTLKHADIIAKTDPDVEVESQVISESKRLQKLQMFRAYVKDVMSVQGTDANMRFALKRIGKLSGLMKDEIDRMLPPTVDELDAEDENERLSNGQAVEVEPTDDDMIHVEMHNKAADTPEKYAHIKAHRKNMLLKKVRPEMFPQLQAKMAAAQGEDPMKALAEAMGGAPSVAPNVPDVGAMIPNAQ
jgi:hypothetical protein